MAQIVRYPDERLRRSARAVDAFDERLREIAEDMITTMEAASGVGLAAPQIGLLKRIVIVDIRPMTQVQDEKGIPRVRHPLEDRMPLALVNPEIVDRGGLQIGQEGCLSLPEIWADVKRARWVRVAARDVFGKSLDFECSDFFARAVQHEIDHLDGVLFIDHLDAESLRTVRPGLRKLEKQFKRRKPASAGRR